MYSKSEYIIQDFVQLNVENFQGWRFKPLIWTSVLALNQLVVALAALD